MMMMLVEGGWHEVMVLLIGRRDLRCPSVYSADTSALAYCASALSCCMPAACTSAASQPAARPTACHAPLWWRRLKRRHVGGDEVTGLAGARSTIQRLNTWLGGTNARRDLCLCRPTGGLRCGTTRRRLRACARHIAPTCATTRPTAHCLARQQRKSSRTFRCSLMDRPPPPGYSSPTFL